MTTDRHESGCKLTDVTALVRVYKLPTKLTGGFCTPRAVPIIFLNVDWFEASVEAGPEALKTFIRSKRYYDEREDFLVLGDHPDFVFTL